MAEFSKEYCEAHDPEMPSDFNVAEMAETLAPEHYIPIICEGYGFVGIYRTIEGNVALVFNKDTTTSDGGQEIELVRYEDLEERYAARTLPWQIRN